MTLDRSSMTWADSGLIQVLNCCYGNSCASWSTQESHRLCPASDPVGPAWMLLSPSAMVLASFLSPSVDSYIFGAPGSVTYQGFIHKAIEFYPVRFGNPAL